MNYTIGARGSRLSVAQTRWIAEELGRANPDSQYTIVPISTRGDADPRPLFAIDQRGIFEKEIDRAVAQRRVDFAVHSLKDVPSELDADLTLACIPRRQAIHDVIISGDGAGLDSIASGGVVGTSSLRRAVQIMRKRPDLQIKPIRGNIETRIGKVSGEYDAVVLAQAGIARLKLDVKYVRLPLDEFCPSPGQGALAIVARADEPQTIKMLKKIEDAQSRGEIEAERALSCNIESGCRFPVGAYAVSDGDEMTLRAVAFSVDGKVSISAQKTGPADNPGDLGRRAAEDLQKQGMDGLALNWREKVEEWNRQ